MHELVVPVVRRDAYQIGYERAAGVTLVHVEVRRWSPAIARQFRDDIETAHGLLGEPVYALRDPSRPNQPKFLQRFGFVPCGTVRAASGDVVPIYERSPNGLPIRRWNHQD